MTGELAREHLTLRLEHPSVGVVGVDDLQSLSVRLVDIDGGVVALAVLHNLLMVNLIAVEVPG